MFAALAVSSLSVLVAQSPTALALDTIERCRAVMIGDAPADAATRWIEMDGVSASVTLGRYDCGLNIDGWRGRDDGFLTTLRDGLLAEIEERQVVDWRKPVVTEYGPTLWTVIVESDVTHGTGHWVQIIEPADGGTGSLNVTYGTAP